MERGSRGAVVWGVLVRSWLLTIAGGSVVGLIAGCMVAITDDDLDSGPFAVIAGLSFVGVLAGIVLGVVLGLVVSFVAAAAFVPYPGQAKVLNTVRPAATVSVGALIGFVTASSFDSGWAALVTTLVAMVLAWFVAPQAVRWYIDDMERAGDAPAGVVPDGS